MKAESIDDSADSAIQDLLNSIDPNRVLPQAQTLALARRILSSSIGTNSSTPDVSSGSSVLKKTQRALRKCNLEGDPSANQIIQNAHRGIYRKEGDIVANSTLLLCARLAGSSNQTKRSIHPDLGSQLHSLSIDKKENMPSADTFPSSTPADTSTLSTNRSMTHIKKAVMDEESALLRECIHAMNFTNSGELIRFTEPGHNITTEDSPSNEHALSIKIRPGLLPFYLPPEIRTEIRSRNTSLGGGLSGLDAIGICTEAGYLYYSIQEYINAVSNTSTGVMPRALASTLDKELQNYRHLLMDLETKVIKGDLTLRRLMSVVYGAIPTLQTMVCCINGLLPHSIGQRKDTDNWMKGGQLLSALYLHSMHGEENHKYIATQLLQESSHPWYDMLFNWLMEGFLNKGSKDEFFIMENESISDEDMWRSRYLLVHEQVPFIPGVGTKGGLISHGLAEDVLVVGKAINFIRRCLADNLWELDMRELLTRGLWHKALDNKGKLLRGLGLDVMKQVRDELGLIYKSNDAPMDIGGISGRIRTQSPLERTVKLASTQVHKHLLTSLFNDHNLLEHLHGMKEILFLGQGDFICTLMDGLHTEFESRLNINELYSLQLMNIVHDALRTTNAKFLPSYVLDRVIVTLLPTNDEEIFWTRDAGDIKKEGWDIFSLGYDIDAPLTAVVHPDAMTKYKLVFSLLFRLKRIEWMMNNTWRQSTVLNHALQVMMSKYGELSLGPASSVKRDNDFARMKRLLRKFAMTRQCILHFITNLQSYLMFEVLESGWKRLCSRLRSAKSLDEVIVAHNDYLDEIVAKCLLSHDLREGKDKTDTQKISLQLRMVLTSALRFCKSHEKVFGEALVAIEKADKKQRGASQRSKAGKWGFDHFDKDVEGNNFYRLAEEGRLEEVELIAEEFDISVRNLLSMLNERINGGDLVQTITSPSQTPMPLETNRTMASYNDSLRFLTFRLDFSAYYGL